MSAFLSKLVVQDDNGLPMTLWLSLLYESDLLKRILAIEAGFSTDFASIPWIARIINLPKHGPWDRPAVVHDYLCRYAERILVDGKMITRAMTDAVLREAMIVTNVSEWQRKQIYGWVRLGGWWSWRKYRKAYADAASRQKQT